jgi:hypothetical protein
MTASLKGARPHGALAAAGACTAWAVRDGWCIGHQLDAAEAQAKGGATTSRANRS